MGPNGKHISGAKSQAGLPACSPASSRATRATGWKPCYPLGFGAEIYRGPRTRTHARPEHTHNHICTHAQTQTDTDRQTDRRTDRQTDTHTHTARVSHPRPPVTHTRRNP